jgi:hypothetical protein
MQKVRAITRKTIHVGSNSNDMQLPSPKTPSLKLKMENVTQNKQHKVQVATSCTTTPMSEWIRTNFSDEKYFKSYDELGDFLEGPGLDNNTALTHAVCEFRDLSWYFHFPHA